MFKTALCALLLVGSLAVNIQSPAWTSKDQKVLAQIQQSGWGSFILNFAELHLQTGGILSELNGEIEKLVPLFMIPSWANLTQNSNKCTTNTVEEPTSTTERSLVWSRRSKIRREVFPFTIASELFNANDFYDNVLIPQRDRFQNQLEQLQENIANNRQTLAEETHQREVDHDAFEAKVAEYNEAISAIDESLGLLSQLAAPSLVQVKKIQKNLTRI